MSDKLEAIYAKIPSIKCQGLCTDACGPIPLTQLELRRIKTRGHKTPKPVPPRGSCSLLEKGKCVGYDVRPIICRLYGVARGMKCNFGCEPDRWLSKEEAYALIDEVQQISPLTLESEMLVGTLNTLRGI